MHALCVCDHEEGIAVEALVVMSQGLFRQMFQLADGHELAPRRHDGLELLAHGACCVKNFVSHASPLTARSQAWDSWRALSSSPGLGFRGCHRDASAGLRSRLSGQAAMSLQITLRSLSMTARQ